MTTHKLGNLTIARISKQAVLDGLSERTEQLSKQLESTLEQIKITQQELDALDELQTKSPNDPETQDPPHATQPLSKIDLEPANHPED